MACVTVLAEVPVVKQTGCSVSASIQKNVCAILPGLDSLLKILLKFLDIWLNLCYLADLTSYKKIGQAWIGCFLRVKIAWISET